MRRAINTIKKEEYNQLLKEAAQRMSKTFFRLCEEEDMKMREADDKGNFDKAEKHDFNARALRCMADMYYKLFNLDNVDSIVNLNKVWHDASEEPTKEEMILCADDLGYMWQSDFMLDKSFDKWSDFVKFTQFTKWAYSCDLLPAKED